MAAPNAHIALRFQASLTYQQLPLNQRQEWLTKVSSFPSTWLQKPVNGERFDSPARCLERLNAFGFLEGALFVIGKSRQSTTPTWEYWCQFHSAKTANKWHLEDRVVRDLENEVVTKRQRDTQNKRRDCPVAYALSFKIVNWDTKERAYVGHWKEDTHQNHDLHLNPFSFHKHEQSLDTHQRLVAQARRFRINHQTYSKACRLLKDDGNGLFLSQKTYYNLVRYQKPDKNKSDTIDGLLIALKDEGFHFRLRTEDGYEGSGANERLVSRKLIQIFFYSPTAVQLAQLWTAGHAISVDATFNTNSHRLPLLVAVGITNEDKTLDRKSVV